MHSHLIGNDACKCCFPKSGRPIEQNVIQSLSSRFGSLYIYRQRLFGFLLPDIICQALGAQFTLDLKIFFQIFSCYDSFSHNNLNNPLLRKDILMPLSVCLLQSGSPQMSS